MQLTPTEQEYLQHLADDVTFEEMAVALSWMLEEVEDFGMKFFDRAFEIKAHAFPMSLVKGNCCGMCVQRGCLAHS